MSAFTKLPPERFAPLVAELLVWLRDAQDLYPADALLCMCSAIAVLAAGMPRDDARRALAICQDQIEKQYEAARNARQKGMM